MTKDHPQAAPTLAGAAPRVGDFVYQPDNQSVGLIGPVTEEFSQTTGAIAGGFELRLLCDYSILLPVTPGARVVRREEITGFVQFFVGQVVQTLRGRLIASQHFHASIRRLLEDDAALDARTLFSSEEMVSLRPIFDIAAAHYFTGQTEEAQAGRVVAYTAIFSEDYPR